MPISSLLLDVASGEESAVVELLQALESLEVHQVRQGQIIVVTDTRSLEEDRALTAQVDALPGVVTASVVFSNMEDCVGDTESPGAAGAHSTAAAKP